MRPITRFQTVLALILPLTLCKGKPNFVQFDNTPLPLGRRFFLKVAADFTTEDLHSRGIREGCCLVRSPDMTPRANVGHRGPEQDVAVKTCRQLLDSKERDSGLWIFNENGRIHGTNGLCLEARDLDQISNVVAAYVGPCSGGTSRKSGQWALNESGYLHNAAVDKFLATSRNTLDQSTTCVELDTTLRLLGESEQGGRLLKFLPVAYDDHLYFVQQMEAEALQQQLGMQRFSELHRSRNAREDRMARINSQLMMARKDQTAEKEIIGRIETLLKELESDLRLPVNEEAGAAAGTGALVQVFYEGERSPSKSFVWPTVEISRGLLFRRPSEGRRNIPDINPVTAVRVQAMLRVPENGRYTFIASDLKSDIRVIVGGIKVIDQWTPPSSMHFGGYDDEDRSGGSVTSNEAIPLKASEEVDLVVSSTGVEGVPTFSLQWQNDRNISEPTKIPTSALYPNIVGPICAPMGFIKSIDCTTTFSQLSMDEGEARDVYCRPGCLTEAPQPLAYGPAGCYALHSSVCTAAVHSGVLPSRGGVIIVRVQNKVQRGQYEASEGFMISTSEAPAGVGCGIVDMLDSQGGPYAIVSVKSVDVKDLQGKNHTHLTGYSGTLSNSPNVLLWQRGYDAKSYMSAVRLVCGGAQLGGVTEERAFDQEIKIGAGASLLVKQSDGTSKSTGGFVSDMFLTLEEGAATNEDPLAARHDTGITLYPSKDGYNRQTCATQTHMIHLYYKITEEEPEYRFPSITVRCGDTFSSLQLQSSHATTSVRCPRECLKDFSPVYGMLTYLPQSSICRSAIHSGVISNAGGVVEIHRQQLPAPPIFKSLQNEIESTSNTTVTAGTSIEAFVVNSPSGRFCHYPQNDILAHVTMGIPKDAVASSFLQINQKATVTTQWMFPPPPAVVDLQTATTPGIFENMENNQIRSPIKAHEFDHTDGNFTPLSRGVEAVRFQLLSTKELLDARRNVMETVGVASTELSKIGSNINTLHDEAKHDSMDLKALETLLHDVQWKIEHHINELERSVRSVEDSLYLHSEGNNWTASALFADFDRTGEIVDDWLVIDAADALNGPSAWSLKHLPVEWTSPSGIARNIGNKNPETAIVQESTITSQASVGTMLILKGRTYPEGFVTCRVKLPTGRYGTAGIVVKFLNTADFVIFEMTRPSVRGNGGENSYIQFREMKNGYVSSPHGRTECDLPGGWLNVALKFSATKLSASIGNGKVKSEFELSSPMQGVGVGVTSNALGQDTQLAFDSIVVGSLEDADEFLSFAIFGPGKDINDTEIQSPTGMVHKTLVPLAQHSVGGISNVNVSHPQHRLADSEMHKLDNVEFGPGGSCLMKMAGAGPESRLSDIWEQLDSAPGADWALTSADEEFGRSINCKITNENANHTATMVSMLNARVPLCRTYGSGMVKTYGVVMKVQNGGKGGIVFRSLSANTYNAILLDFTDPDTPQLVSLSVRNNQPSSFMTETSERMRADVWYPIRLEDDGAHIKVFVNNIMVLQEQIGPEAGLGRFGFIVFSGSLQFSHFTARA